MLDRLRGVVGPISTWQPQAIVAANPPAKRAVVDDALLACDLRNTWQPGVPLAQTIADVVHTVVANVASDLGWPVPTVPPSIMLETATQVALRRQLATAQTPAAWGSAASMLPDGKWAADARQAKRTWKDRLLTILSGFADSSAVAYGASIAVAERIDAFADMEWHQEYNAARVTPERLKQFLAGPLAEFAAVVHHELVHEAQLRLFPDFLPRHHQLGEAQVIARMALIEGHALHFERQARERHYGVHEDNLVDDAPLPRSKGVRAVLRTAEQEKTAQYAAGARVVRHVLAKRPDLLDQLFAFPELAELALMQEGRVTIDLARLSRAGVDDARGAVALLRGLNPHPLTVDLV